MTHSGFELTRFFTTIQLLLIFFAVLFSRINKFKRVPLALFLFGQACIILTGTFYGVNQQIGAASLPIFHTIFAGTFLIGPSLFLYTHAVLNKREISWRTGWYHAVPFVVILVLNPIFICVPTSDLFLVKNSISHTPGAMATLALLHGQILMYISVSITKLSRVRSAGAEPTEEGMLRFLLFTFLAVWLAESIILLTINSSSDFLCWVKIAMVVFQFGVVNVVVFHGVRSSTQLAEKQIKIKYINSRLSESHQNELLDRIKSTVSWEKLYLQPDLTLQQVSANTGISVHHISQALNAGLGMNFNDFINGYRVEESKRLLLEQANAKITILEVLYDAGFTSKSVFNNAFKKHTGLTPSEFKLQFCQETKMREKKNRKKSTVS